MEALQAVTGSLLTPLQRKAAEIRANHPNWAESTVRRAAGYSESTCEQTPRGKVSTVCLEQLRREQGHPLTPKEAIALGLATASDVLQDEDPRVRLMGGKLLLDYGLNAPDYLDATDTLPREAALRIGAMIKRIVIAVTIATLARPEAAKRRLARAKASGEGPIEGATDIMASPDKI